MPYDTAAYGMLVICPRAGLKIGVPDPDERAVADSPASDHPDRPSAAGERLSHPRRNISVVTPAVFAEATPLASN